MKSSIQSRFGYFKLLTVAAACLAFQHADATLLFEDGFNYNDGSLGASDVSPPGLSGNAWAGGNSHIVVTNFNLTYPGLQNLGGNGLQDTWGINSGTVYNTYANQTSGSIYYSFLLDATVAPSGTNYLTSLNPGTSTPNGSGDALQVDVGAVGSGYEVGLRTAGASLTLDPFTLLTAGNTYLVVAEFTFGGNGTASLYVDPIPGGSQGPADVTLTGNGTVSAIDDVGFKAQSSGTGTFLIDNLMIGTTWADVTPAVTLTPEPQSYALMLAGFMAFIFAKRFRRRLAPAKKSE